jgi:signal transduction histidine kinase
VRLSSPRLWALALSLGAVAGAIYTLFLRNARAYDSSIHVPWQVLALAFAATEVFVAHVHFRKQSESFSLSEVPLIVGLFFVAPGVVIAAQLTGGAIALALHRKNPPLKLVFNLTQFALGTTVAALIMRAIARPGAALTSREALAAVTAVLASAVIGVLCVVTAISVAEGENKIRAKLPSMLPMGTIVAVTNSSVALIGVALLRTAPLLAVLLLVPAAMLFLAYRAYTMQRKQTESLDMLYRSTRTLNQRIDLDTTVRMVLEQARSMFRAEIAQVTLLPEDGGPGAQRARLGAEDAFEPMRAIELDPTVGVWARVVSEGYAVSLPRPIENDRLRAYFETQGMRDAMVAPLYGTDGVAGTVTVANRLGDISTFDDSDLTLFQTFVNHVSVSIQNARLVHRLQASLSRQQDLNKAKDDFVATISHELRTPLTSIQGFAKTLLRQDIEITPDETRAWLQVIERQGQNLGMLIEDLLLVSRLESQPARVQMTEVLLPELMEQVIEGFMHRPGARRIELRLEAQLASIQTDRAAVGRILSNLLENALKYTADNTSVRVVGRAIAGGVVLSVEDEGDGIPEEERERIFDRFYQVDQSRTRRVGGAGLGLYISRTLAESIGGRLWLESQRKRGATFSLWLPAEPGPASLDAARAQRARDKRAAG